MAHETPVKAVLNEESILVTPLPQASSTVDRRPDLLPPPETEVTMKGGKEADEAGRGKYLSDGLLAMGELRQKLMSISGEGGSSSGATAAAPPPRKDDRRTILVDSIIEISHRSSTPRESVASSNSSLGVLHSGFDKRSTGSSMSDLNFDLERKLAREKALKTLCAQDSNQVAVNNEKPTELKDADLHIRSSYHGSFSFPTENNQGEVSGFSEVLGESDIRRDESWCAANFNGLPIKPNDVSLTGISSSDRMSVYFRRFDDSLLSALGPCDPPKARYLSDSITSVISDSGSIYEGKENKYKKNALVGDVPDVANILSEQNGQGKRDKAKEKLHVKETRKKEEIDKISLGSLAATEQGKRSTKKEGLRSADDVHERMSRLSSLLESINDWSLATSFTSEHDIDAYLGNSGREHSPPCRDVAPLLEKGEGSPELLRVSEIAKLLQQVPADATPLSLAKKVMDGQRNKVLFNKGDSATGSDSESFVIESQSPLPSSDESNDDQVYNAVAVFGSGTQVEIIPENPSDQSLWSFSNYDSTKIIAKIKQDNPALITVLLLPLVNENMILTIQEISYNKRESVYSCIHKVNLVLEAPKVTIEGVDDILDLGCVPQCSVIKKEIKISCNNSNMIILCPKFTKDNLDVLKLEYDGENGELNLFPGTDMTANIILSPKHATCQDPNKSVKMVSFLEFFLLPIFEGIPPVCRIGIKAEIFNCKLQMRMESDKEALSPNEERSVIIRNASACPVRVKISTHGNFSCATSEMLLEVGVINYIMVTFTPDGVGSCDGALVLTTIPGNLNHFISLHGKFEPPQLQPGFPSSPSSVTLSNPGSVNSSFSSGSINTSEVAEGELMLECTQSFVVWSSQSLDAKPVLKTTWIRSKGKQREKLTIHIEDPTMSYHLVTKNGDLKQSMVVTLSSMHRKELCIQFAPKQVGQFKADLFIHRVNTDVDKRQIYLFGYGGYGQVRAEEVSMDLENKSFKIPLSTDSLKGHFTLKNVGDGTAFFNISQRKVEGMYLQVSPDKGLIEPGEGRSVSLSLSLDRPGPSFVEHLLQKDKRTDIILSSLNVTYGDQPTRLRISRLYKKNKNKPELSKSLHVSTALANLCHLFPTDKASREAVSKLKDPLSSVWSLFEEGIHEWMIQVIIPRRALEDIQLDTTQLFTTFANPLDETENTTMFDCTSVLQSSRF